MEKGATTQRKLSRGRSMQSSRGIFSRKSVKKFDSQSLSQTPSSLTVVTDDYTSLATGKEKEQERYSLEDNVSPRPLFPVRSIIPDPLNELPAWYTQAAEDVPSTVPQFRSKYPMHNAVGPRWYKNCHLSPSFLENRPPSFFSPSFPPMAASADRAQESKIPGPSRTPSGSPLPTPTSSQTRIHDVRARSRKVSQTAHDNVDMLDGTDPWGTNWHHQSPYDVGSDRASPDSAPESPVVVSRPRRMSTNTGSRHKTTIPSPLSQSTSAVNLQSEAAPVHIPRRLSKSRKPFHDLFGGSQDNGTVSKRVSEPPPLFAPPDRPLKRGMSTGPSMSSSTPSIADKKEKRGSILGRLAKRFSVMRKHDRYSAKDGNVESASGMNGRPSLDTLLVAPARSTPSPQKSPLHHSKSSDVSRRVPPPPLFDDEPPSPLVETSPKDDDVSMSSFEAPFPIGKLTIANPDEPTPPSPAEDMVPLPALPRTEKQSTRYSYMLGSPLSQSPSQMELPDTPVQHRLSTILSVDAPGTSPLSPRSPPLPDLPLPTPTVMQKALTEPSLPPTPEGTRPPTPEQHSPVSQTPASLALSNGTNARNALSYAMSPSSLSAFEASLPSSEDLPLSRASMVVEPPTPHAPVLLIPAQTNTLPMPSPEQVLQSNGVTRTARESSPSKRDGSQRVKGSSSSTKSRRTETFKLIRSPSGHVQTVGESFVVEGEHWEVVADEKKVRKERPMSSDIETTPSPRRRESKKTGRGDADDASDKKSRDRHRKSGSGKSHDHTGRSSTYSDTDTVRQSTAERRRSSTKERNRDSNGDVVRSTQTPVTPPTHSKSISGTTLRRERRTSSSATRPSSEFQSAAGINALKAKEAWDMERLWKGRSMVYGPDGTTVISTRPTIGSDSRPSTIMSPDLHRATSIPSVGDSQRDLQRASTLPVTHGSSHTYFMVQTPAHGSSSYDQIPIPSISQNTKSTTTRNDQKLYRPFPDTIPFPSNTHKEPLPNPLPDPPRLSVYKASPLPPSLAGSGDGPSSSEYWTKYAGVPTTTNH